MKNIKFLFLFSLAALLFACEKEYEPLNDYSAVDWYTSSFRYEKLLGLDDYMSFSDLSQNSLEHSWTFSDTSGCKFLKGQIVRQDSVYTHLIDENLTTKSTDKTVHILFTKPGLQNVRLRNTFSEPVTFKGNDTLEAVKEGDVWVIDTTFVVDVYDTIQSAFKVLYENAEIANINFDEQSVLADSSSWPVQEIMAGESLEFVDMTTVGRPNERTWYINGGNPSTSNDSAAVVHFYKLGTFYTRMVSSRTGQNLPGGSKMKYVPLKIKVNKSTLPFERVGNIVEMNNETIQFSVSGEVAPFTGKEGDFTVHVTNSNGFDQNIAVQSATVNSQNGTIIELKLAEAIYNSDVITVSYAGNTIQSQDERDLAAFTDVSVKMYAPNLFDSGIYSFETGHENWESIDKGVVEVTDEKAFSGAYSLKLQSAPGDVWTAAEATGDAAKATLIKGTAYTLSWKLWRDPSSTDNVLGPWLKWGDSQQQQFWTGLNPLPKGEWVTITKEFTYNGPGLTWFWIRVKDNNLVYIDDISIVKKEVRPAP